MNTSYPTNLTDKQWQVIEKVINPQERARKHSLRDIMNAILYINKTGCHHHAYPSCKGDTAEAMVQLAFSQIMLNKFFQ